MTDPTRCVIRVWGDEAPIGGGVLVAGNQILTASHVVNLALGRDITASARPGESSTVSVDFPLLGGDRVACAVERWQSPKRGDVATLSVQTAIPPTAAPALIEIQRRSLVGLTVRVMGFPADGEAGVWVEARITGPLASQHLQVNNYEAAGYLLEPGFSGSPIFSQTEDVVVGMIVRADVPKRTAMAVPALTLVQRFWFAEPMRGTDNWKLGFFRGMGIGSLLNDLVASERTGIEDDECASIQAMLGRVSNEVADWEAIAAWETPLHEDIEGIQELYIEWNGHQAGPSGETHRRSTLKAIRRHRYQLSNKIRAAQPVLYQLELDEPIDRIIAHLRVVANQYPDRFRSVSAMLVEYESRCR